MGSYTFSAQLVFIVLPLLLGKGIIWSIYGLLVITFARWIWLIILLRRYTKPKISIDFIKEHLYLGIPLILTTLISGSGQYIDGVIVSAVYRDPAKFALFRYGAKEFPLVLMLANGLNAAMLSEFSTREKMRDSCEKYYASSQRSLCTCFFPITMIMMLIARWFYPIMFRQEFELSSGIFLVYSLLIIPRLVFPQTIVIGRKRPISLLLLQLLRLS